MHSLKQRELHSRAWEREGEAQNSQVQTSKGYNPALFTAGPRAEWHPIDCALCTAHCADSFCSTAICMLAGDAPDVSVCQINSPGDSLCYLQCQRLGGKRYTTAFLSVRVQKGDERTDANHKIIHWGAGNEGRKCEQWNNIFRLPESKWSQQSKLGKAEGLSGASVPCREMECPNVFPFLT